MKATRQKRKKENPLKVVSGKTPKVRRYITHNKYYGDFTSPEKVAKFVSRTNQCTLCANRFRHKTKSEKKCSTRACIVEHSHRTGNFRGHTCRRCNVVEGKALSMTLNFFKVSRKQYEQENIALPKNFLQTHASLFSQYFTNMSVEEAQNYILGKEWEVAKKLFDD